MPRPLQIPARDKEFCLAVAEVVFRNPFDDSVGQLHRKITGTRRQISPDKAVEAINNALAARIGDWHASNRMNFRNYGEPDAETMKMVGLFEVYHRYYDRLDGLIVDQIEHANQSCPINFADELLAELELRGFSADEALRYFGLLFQVRRAHHFITHGLIGDGCDLRLM